jgi:predicted PurR-regulated permease PerM
MTTERRALFDVSWRAIAKVLIAAALVWAWLQVWHFVMVIIVAIIMAVSLDPAVRWLERKRLSRSISAVLVVFLVTVVLLAMIAVSWVTLRDQSRLIVDRLTESAEQLRASFPIADYLMPSNGGSAGGGGGSEGSTASQGLASYAIAFARSASTAAGMVVLALALTAYLLIEWKRTLEWLMAFVPEGKRQKARRTLEESHGIVFRYAVGNALASAITSVVTYVVLASLQVPAALMLALISGLFNFIPIIGFIVSSVLAALLAATVSTNVLLAVIGFYLAFNVIESYLITPKIFGYEMELSNLAVIVAVIVGAELGGVMGGLLALPVAAIYPTVERIWLRERLGDDTVEIHKRLSA